MHIAILARKDKFIVTYVGVVGVVLVAFVVYVD